MRYIQKEKDEDGNIIEPETLTKWKKEEQETLNNWSNNPVMTGTKMWNAKSIKKQELKSIKEALLENQGYICCYCGSKILNDHNTRIEHVNPKSKEEYKQQTFDYGNLLASCQGGTKNIIHKVEEGETSESIAQSYDVSVEFLEEVYVTTENLEKITKDYDLDDLQIGDKILITPKAAKQQQHCDNRKGSNEIEVTPLQEDCAEKFTYNKGKLNGSIKATNQKAIDAIKILGLNDSKPLKLRRADIINKSMRIRV